MCSYFCLHYGARLDGLKQAGETAKRKEDRNKCVKKCLNKYIQFKMNKQRHDIEN